MVKPPNIQTHFNCMFINPLIVRVVFGDFFIVIWNDFANFYVLHKITIHHICIIFYNL